MKKKDIIFYLTDLIKICVDPQCEAIYHNIPKKVTKCNDCSGRVIIINQKTYWTKFSKNFFQYDFKTKDFYRPEKKQKQFFLDL